MFDNFKLKRQKEKEIKEEIKQSKEEYKKIQKQNKKIIKKIKKDKFNENIHVISNQNLKYQSPKNNKTNTYYKNEDYISYIYGEGEIPPLHPKIYPLFLDWLGKTPKPLYENKKDNDKGNKNLYPFYIIYEWGLTDPKKFHKKLIKDNYLNIATPQEAIQSLTINQLKSILKDNNISTTGNKNKLIEKCLLINNLDKYINKTFYVLTPKSKKIIQENDEFLYVDKFIRKYPYNLFTHEEYEEIKREINYLQPTYDDIILYLLVKKAKLSEDKNDFSTLRTIYLELYHLFKKKEDDKAIRCLINILDMDISGIRNIIEIDNVINIITDDDISLKLCLNLAPGIVKFLKKYDYIKVKKELDKNIFLNLPFRYFKKEIVKEIILKAYETEETNFYEEYKNFANK